MMSIRTPIRGMRWWRRRRFLKAYRIVRNEASRHRAAGHDVHFAAVNEAMLSIECRNCPELLP